MEFFQDTNIDFMKYRKHFVLISVALLAISVLEVFIQKNLNIGIDFSGGTQVTVKFRQQPRVDELRDVMSAADIGDAQIQRFGAEEANEVIIKTSTVEGSEEGSQLAVIEALDQHFNGESAGGFDLNQRGSDSLASLLLQSDPDRVVAQDPEVAQQRYEELAEAILEQRRVDGLLESWDEVAGVAGVSNEVRTALERQTYLGDFAVLGSENVGPQIGSELRRKGILAVVSSLLGMLVYIWFRFELRFAIGALVAVTHDVLIVLGLFTLAGLEFNLTTIAGFLTLVGYSVNDTVVVFDRVRENLRRNRREPLVETMNLSLNQTLSRTVLTSGTTLLAVGSLLLFGGDVLRGFAFIITVGVIVGTYSSIYIASPFALLWEQWFGKGSKGRASNRATA
ncbi:MAG: protein translocase subunit SecF [Nitrospirae bacterium]|nr:protein translocase subunit SecF [Nitrospirota bacterium]